MNSPKTAQNHDFLKDYRIERFLKQEVPKINTSFDPIQHKRSKRNGESLIFFNSKSK